MKKCPACEKTFEDSMRFCQIDGTPLVDDAPFDPFATIAGNMSYMSEPETETAPSDPSVSQTGDASAISEPDDVLDLAENDPLKTMYVSDDEMKAALKPDEITPEPGVFDIQPIEDTSSEQTLVTADESPVPEFDEPAFTPEPELPSFDVPDVPAPHFGDPAPPPSPFSSDSAADAPVSAPTFDEPLVERKLFNEAETIIQGEFANPFESPSAPVAEWTPPPAPEPSWEDQPIESNMQFQPPSVPSATNAGQNKTLPIISLVLGILSLCCYVSPLTGIAALVTGFIGMKNANNMPDLYGGKGLAIAGMVTGGLFFAIGIVYWIFLLFFGGMAMIMDAAR